MRVGVQAPLGFAAGIPLYLSSLTLSKWLADRGVDMEPVGLFALVALPYNVKFLWAPLFDRYAPPWLDQRRGWMLVFAALTGVAIAAMSAFDAATQATSLAVAALCVATLSASLDVVVDAYRAAVQDRRVGGAAALVTVPRRGRLRQHRDRPGAKRGGPDRDHRRGRHRRPAGRPARVDPLAANEPETP